MKKISLFFILLLFTSCNDDTQPKSNCNFNISKVETCFDENLTNTCPTPKYVTLLQNCGVSQKCINDFKQFTNLSTSTQELEPLVISVEHQKSLFVSDVVLINKRIQCLGSTESNLANNDPECQAVLQPAQLKACLINLYNQLSCEQIKNRDFASAESQSQCKVFNKCNYGPNIYRPIVEADFVLRERKKKCGISVFVPGSF